MVIQIMFYIEASVKRKCSLAVCSNKGYSIGNWFSSYMVELTIIIDIMYDLGNIEYVSKTTLLMK